MQFLRHVPFFVTGRLPSLSTGRAIRLTSEGTRFLFFTLAIGMAAVNTGNNLFYLLLGMMLSLIVVSGFLSKHCLRRLSFHRHVPDLIMTNEPATVSISVSNRNSRLPSCSLRLLDVIEGQDVDRGLYIRQLPAQCSVLLSYPLLATKRGRVRLDQVRAETLFPFGLFLHRALYPLEATVLVGPPIKSLSLRFIDELLSEGLGQPLRRRGHSAQLYNLRLYQPGDDSRAIHWMTTARTSQLTVRETEAEDQRHITVILSCAAPDHLDELFERSVTFVASLLWYLSARGCPLRLLVGSDDSGLGTGSDHLFTMMRLLALCARHRPAPAHQHGRDVMVPHDTDGGYRLAVVPWSESEMPADAVAADRVLHGMQLEDLTHAF